MSSFLAQVEEGWWEGVLNGKTGMFPSNFIKELSDSDDTGTVQQEQLIKPSKDTNVNSPFFVLALVTVVFFTAMVVFPGIPASEHLLPYVDLERSSWEKLL